MEINRSQGAGIDGFLEGEEKALEAVAGALGQALAAQMNGALTAMAQLANDPGAALLATALQGLAAQVAAGPAGAGQEPAPRAPTDQAPAQQSSAPAAQAGATSGAKGIGAAKAPKKAGKPGVAGKIKKGGVSKARAPKAAGKAARTHRVKSGDTLWAIARKSGVSLDALIAANPAIANPDLIYPGQKVKIPAGGHAAGGSGGAAPAQQGGGAHRPSHGSGKHPSVGGSHGGDGMVSGEGVKDVSPEGRRQMATLLKHAKENSGGKRALGWCLREVQDILQRGSYGKIGNGHIPRFPYAHDFADYLNAGHPPRWKGLGLKRLDIDNPYDAPPGAIVVVRAGTPGTHHPTAGDIAIAAGGGRFLNDGEMGYGGSGNFRKGNNYVLGVYVPA